MGGTMRLGADPIKLHPDTRAREIYGEAVIYERHRHRYEVNNFLRKRLEAAGLVCSGTSPDERLVEIIEIPDHPFFVASQYHPEFKSRPERPAPLFREFVARRARAARASAPAGARRRGEPRGRRAERAAGRSARRVRPASEAEKARLDDTFAELCRIPSPFGRGARVRRRASPPSCAAMGSVGGRRRGRRGRQPARARSRGARRAHDPAVRAPGHGAAGRADRAGARRRRLGERQRRHPRRRQQGRGGDDARGRAPLHASRARRSASSCCSRSPRRSALQGAKRFDARGCAPSSATCSTTRRRSARSSTASPTLYRIEAEFHGKSAHAGLRPEDGPLARSSPPPTRRRACRTAASTTQTTANLGYFHGGVESTNVVPERARLLAEVRSVDPDKAEEVARRR